MATHDVTGRTAQPSGMAVGITFTAAFILIFAGFFGILEGIVGLVNNEFYVVTQKWVFKFDSTTWGWIHIIVGFIALCAGFGLFAGLVWAGLGADRRCYRGMPQHDRQLLVAAVLPVVGIADYRLRLLRYLGSDRARSRPQQPFNIGRPRGAAIHCFDGTAEDGQGTASSYTDAPARQVA